MANLQNSWYFQMKAIYFTFAICEVQNTEGTDVKIILYLLENGN